MGTSMDSYKKGKCFAAYAYLKILRSFESSVLKSILLGI